MRKIYTFGYANKGQPFVYWNGDTHKTDPPKDFSSVRMMMFVVERAVDLMVAGVE